MSFLRLYAVSEAKLGSLLAFSNIALATAQFAERHPSAQDQQLMRANFIICLRISGEHAL
jgi:hypothetical protein